MTADYNFNHFVENGVYDKGRNRHDHSLVLKRGPHGLCLIASHAAKILRMQCYEEEDFSMLAVRIGNWVGRAE